MIILGINENESVVHKPKRRWRVFLKTKIVALIMESFIIKKID